MRLKDRLVQVEPVSARRRTLPLGLAVLLLLGGCAGATTTTNPFAPPGERGAAYVRIMAQSQANEDVRVYALNGGSTSNLGVVRARSIESFRLPWSNGGSLRLRLDPLTGLQHTTNSVLVRPGDILDLYIAQDPSNSYVRVR